jgi:hypothetical protein
LVEKFAFNCPHALLKDMKKSRKNASNFLIIF